MAVWQKTLPSCCSVGFLHSFHQPIPNDEARLPWDNDPYNPYDGPSKTGYWLAIFSKNQKPSFDRLCKYHTCISAVAIPGAHGQPLVVCIFKKGKANETRR